MEFNKINLGVEKTRDEATRQIHFVFKKYNKTYAILTFNFATDKDFDKIYEDLKNLLERMGDKMHYKEW